MKMLGWNSYNLFCYLERDTTALLTPTELADKWRQRREHYNDLLRQYKAEIRKKYPDILKRSKETTFLIVTCFGELGLAKVTHEEFATRIKNGKIKEGTLIWLFEHGPEQVPEEEDEIDYDELQRQYEDFPTLCPSLQQIREIQRSVVMREEGQTFEIPGNAYTLILPK